MRATATPLTALAQKWLHPMRVSPHMFSGRLNPWMISFGLLAPHLAASSRGAARDNPWMQFEHLLSQSIIIGLDRYRNNTDHSHMYIRTPDSVAIMRLLRNRTCGLYLALATSFQSVSPVDAVSGCDNGADLNEPLIERCTRLIESGPLLGRDLANALLARANALGASGEYDRAIVDYTEALRLAPTAAILFHNRGNAWLRKEDYARAIADYDEAIRIRPAYPSAFNNRGSARFSSGDYGGALADYDQAIALDPNYAAAYLNRGFLQYVRAQFVAAGKDFSAARRLQPSEPYAVIWLYLALGRASTTAPAKGPTSAQLTARWPAPIARFLNGEITYNQLVAVEAPSAEQRVLQHCEAVFFAAESDVIHGRRSQARAGLELAKAACPPAFVEHHAAVAELMRLSR